MGCNRQFFRVCSAGDEIVRSRTIYGALKYFSVISPLGKSEFVDMHKHKQVKAAS
jgi:O-acetylhomoserine/O-acetylserine sulfhydrylase-like pyridoxal-dependent enzyme